MREAPWRLSERLYHVDMPHSERPCDGDGLKLLRWEVSLSSVELAPLTMAQDVLGVHHCCGLIECLSESFSDKCPWTIVMPTRVSMDLA
jgi:hypothetical protein